MQLTIVALLCLGVAYASGAVRPLFMPLENHEKVYTQRQHPYALILPLTDETAHQLSTGAYRLEVVESENEDVVPQQLTRVRRQLSGGVAHDNQRGTTLSGQATGTLYASPDGQHKVTGNVHGERTYNIPGAGNGPFTYGAGANYDHATRGGAGVDVTRTPGGTQFSAQGRGTVWQSRDGNGRLDAHGSYSRNYGGPYGTGSPSYGVGATYSHRF